MLSPRLMSARCLPLLLVLAAGAVGCRSASGQEGEHGFGAVPTVITKLDSKTVADFDDYLASLTSRNSITLYPQVAGYIRAIRARPGQSVKAGSVLITIDPGQQDALLQSLRANLLTKKATRDYAKRNDESSAKLFKAGLIGELDYEQRHSQLLTAEADVSAGEAQIKAQEALLRFYTISAPIDGVVGDVPVKVGDYVEPQTRLTSLDQNKLVEAYVYVPVAKAGSVKPDTAIQLINEANEVLCEAKPFFVSPQVSVDTQTVLVKTICPNEANLRADQVLQARIVWSRHSGVTIPVSAVSRQSGQYFAWVVDRSAKGTVVHQQPIEVGTILGNEFVVTKGLQSGVEVAVTNVQKLQDGAPVAPAEKGH